MSSAGLRSSKRGARTQPRGGAGQSNAPKEGLLAALATRPWVLALVLALGTLAVYMPVRSHPFFTMDDEQYVAKNPHLQGGFGWDTVTWAFTTYDLANWHPVTWLSHALDVHLFQLDPSGHHEMNLLLHAVDALLLFWVLLRATGYAGRSFMVAGLFALHPINVETVAWIAERKNVLSLMLFLLALGAYRWYASKPRVERYLVVALLYAAGLMAKPQIITFPFVLLLWDYWPLGRIALRSSPFAFRQSDPDEVSGEQRRAKGEKRPSENRTSDWRWLLLEKLPLLALSLGSAMMTMKAQAAAGAVRYYPLSTRLENAIVSYVRYLGKAIWPSRLAVFYPHPVLSAWQVAASLILLLAITGVTVRLRRQGYLAVGWFWFLGTLVPMIGIVQVGEQAMADRYAYLSFIGLFIMICWGVADWAEQRHVSPAWLAASGVTVLVVLSVMTYRQLSYWSDNVTLWSHVASVTSGSYEAEENLGVALIEGGQPEDAMQHFQQVTALVPHSSGGMGRELAGYAAVAHLYLGAYEQHRGEAADAVDHYKQVLALAQDYTAQNVYAKVPPVLIRMEAAAMGNMGDAYLALRDFPDAVSSYQAALQRDPRNARQWLGLGVAQQRSGDLAAATQAYARATQLQSSDLGFLLLSQALEKEGRSEQAKAARQQAEAITQDFEAAQATVKRLLGQ